MRKFWKIILSALLIAGLAFILFVIAVYYGAFGHLQTRQELLSYKNATASVVLSKDGELLGKYFSENRTNVSYRELPSYLVDALIATEDIRFFKHRGYDMRGLMRVFVKTLLLRNRSSGGGSTITQQLAKNMYGREHYGIFTMPVNKTKEIILASRLERIFSKEEILLLYLNTVSFGENVYGIEAAARRFFNKKVGDLSIEESAVLIGLLKANSYYNPRVYPENATKRRNVVLAQMRKYEFLTPEAADSLMNIPLKQNYVNYEIKGPADYFLYQVKSEAIGILQDVEARTGRRWNIEEDGLEITTTLNLELQNYANNAVKEHLAIMQERLNKQYDTRSGKKIAAQVADRELKRLNLEGSANELSLQEYSSNDSSVIKRITVRDSMIQAVKTLQAGIMAIDPVSGEIKAWVGGIDFRSQPYDQILARRQLASTFKPVIYTAAFEQGYNPCDFIENDSITDSGIEGWSPANFDHSYGGKYSLKGALIHSMNVPTYNLYMNVGYNRVDSLWTRMGFSFALPDVPSVAMGVAEASIKEVAVAYSAFANGGFKIEPQDILSIKTGDGEVIWKNEFVQPGTRIIDERSVSLIRAILRRAVIEGTGSALGSVYGVTLPLAGKTGTSQDYADAWFSGFNPSFVIISRVGASSPAIHFNSGSNGSGSTLALPIVARTLKNVQSNKKMSTELFSPFPELPGEMADALDCPDFRDKTFFENVIDIFKGKHPAVREIQKPTLEKPAQQQPQEKEKKKSFFRRLFRK
jgi:penicillin-binding protein 1A